MESLFLFGSVKKNKNRKKKTKGKTIRTKFKNISFVVVLRNDPDDVANPRLTHIALTNVKASTRFSSCLVAVLMLVIATVALVIEWSLLQPIHNELINKYYQQELLYYNRNSFCDLIDLEDFNMLTFPIACLIVLIFIMFSKRASCMRQKLKGYVAPVIPIDFYMHVKRKFAAVVFAIIADELLDIVTQVINGDTSEGDGMNLCFTLNFQYNLNSFFRCYCCLFITNSKNFSHWHSLLSDIICC